MSALGSTLDKVPTLELEQNDKISPCELTTIFHFLSRRSLCRPSLPPQLLAHTPEDGRFLFCGGLTPVSSLALSWLDLENSSGLRGPMGTTQWSCR